MALLWTEISVLPYLLCQTWDGCSEPILQMKQLRPEALSQYGVVEGTSADLLSEAGSWAA